MSERVKVLDHGYVELIETWGSDERIVEAARMSTGKGFLGWGTPGRWLCSNCWVQYQDLKLAEERKSSGTHKNAHGVEVNNDGILFCPFCVDTTMVLTPPQPGDEKLLKYLYEHRHHTPFEMAGMTIEVQAPIMVFREWHRHRTQSYNEMSARYTPLPDMNYMPSTDRCLQINMTNKQAGGIKGADVLSAETAGDWLDELSDFYTRAEGLYQDGLAKGIPKELARLCLPVGRYSRMRASANLRNWIGFLTLRADSAAQWEIRQFAIEVGNIIAQAYPRTWNLYSKGK